MPSEFPILRLAEPKAGNRKPGSPNKRPRPSFSPAEQQRRFGAKFERMEAALDDLDAYKVTDDPDAIIPERALVLKLLVPLSDFDREARRIGLEWLAEDAEDAAEDEASEEAEPDDDEPDLFEDGDEEGNGDEEDEAAVPKRERLYVSLPTPQALRELVKYWKMFKAREPAPKNFGQWWTIFRTLSDLRPWGPEDRVELPTREYLADKLSGSRDGSVTVEVDL